MGLQGRMEGGRGEEGGGGLRFLLVFPGRAFVWVLRLQAFLYILLGPLICFGSVWRAGHEANYLSKGKSEPNEPH